MLCFKKRIFYSICFQNNISLFPTNIRASMHMWGCTSPQYYLKFCSEAPTMSRYIRSVQRSKIRTTLLPSSTGVRYFMLQHVKHLDQQYHESHRHQVKGQEPPRSNFQVVLEIDLHRIKVSQAEKQHNEACHV